MAETTKAKAPAGAGLITEGLRSTLEKYPHIDTVYFDDEGRHYFTSHVTKTVRVKDARSGITRTLAEPCERHVNRNPIVKTLSRKEILKEKN
jgi:hypothetical protein